MNYLVRINFILLLISLSISAVACQRSDTGVAYGTPGNLDDDHFATGKDRPPTRNTLFAMSRLMASQGRDGESAVILARIIREYPHFAPAYQELAELQMRHGSVDEAIRTLSAGLAVSPDDASMQNNIGMCYLIRQDYARALNWFTKAAARTPQDARGRTNMAVALGMLGRYEECLALYQQVLPPAEAHFNLAVICEARKDNERATEEYKHAGEFARTLQ